MVDGEGNWVDGEANWVNGEGNRVDGEGNRVDGEGNIADVWVDGEGIIPDGWVDGKGNWVDGEGNIADGEEIDLVNKDGEFIIGELELRGRGDGGDNGDINRSDKSCSLLSDRRGTTRCSGRSCEEY